MRRMFGFFVALGMAAALAIAPASAQTTPAPPAPSGPLAAFHSVLGFTPTPKYIYAAEVAYVAVYDGAILFAKACNAGVLPAKCHKGIDLVDVALDKAEVVYQQVVKFEKNPPTGLLDSLTAAVAAVQAAIATGSH